MMMKRRYVAIALAAVTLAGVGAGTAYATVTRHTITTTDVVIRTTANTNLSPTGGVQTTIEKLSLPAGRWIVEGDNTMVNFGPSDYVRCSLFKGATELSAHASMVGDPAATGALGPASFVATAQEVDATVLTSPATITLACEHDHTNGATPYVDADSALWAHKTSSLTYLTTR